MKATIQLAAMLLIAILLIATSCNKDKTPEKDEHKDWNVLEWTVDGERYKAECEGDPLFGCDPVDCEFYPDVSGGSIHGSYFTESSIYIYVYRGLEPSRDYRLKKYDKVQVAVNQGGCNIYKLDSLQKYDIKLNYLDTNKKIIEGEFEFTAINNCQDTVHVDDGYFKLTYRP